MTQPTSDPPRVPLARLPTPLERLEKLRAVAGGPTIWVKRDDLTEGPAGGNKLRKLEFSVGQALADGADVLITAGAKQSNHCRQTAFAAARLGLRCHLVLAGRPPRSAPDGNLLLDDLMGAEITYVSEAEFERLPELFEALSHRYREQGASPFCIPVGASDEIGLWGYIECARELGNDFAHNGIEPTHIVAAIGSGATHGGLMVGAGMFGLGAEVLGVTVSRDPSRLQAEIRRLHRRWSERYRRSLDLGDPVPRILGGYVAPGYGRAAAGVYETIREIARLEGLVLDPVYTGKAFDALLQEIRGGRFRDSEDIVFIHTGGIYAIFPHRDRFTRDRSGSEARGGRWGPSPPPADSS